jgi:hypothetical protein
MSCHTAALFVSAYEISIFKMPDYIELNQACIENISMTV